jgi:microcystin-dependent protein
VTTPYIGEIRMFGGNYAPLGWAVCQGQTLQIVSNQALFSLIGTTYGGDGVTTFNLPDLRGRAPMHQGTNQSTGTAYPLGKAGGSEQVALVSSQLPAHTHTAQAQSGPGTQAGPGNAVWATELDPNVRPFSANTSPSGVMNQACVSAAGNGQPHENRMPYLAVNFIIALEGIYPSSG